MSQIEFPVTAWDIERGQNEIVYLGEKPEDLIFSCALALAGERETGCPCAVQWWKTMWGQSVSMTILDDEDRGQEAVSLRIKGAEDCGTLVNWLKGHDGGDTVRPIIVETYVETY